LHRTLFFEKNVCAHFDRTLVTSPTHALAHLHTTSPAHATGDPTGGGGGAEAGGKLRSSLPMGAILLDESQGYDYEYADE
jgi:hypothetical protein